MAKESKNDTPRHEKAESRGKETSEDASMGNGSGFGRSGMARANRVGGDNSKMFMSAAQCKLGMKKC
jgi:hypothetical protein